MMQQGSKTLIRDCQITHGVDYEIFEGGTMMKRITLLLVAIAALAGVFAFRAPASGYAGQEAAPIFVTKIPPDTATGS